MRQKLSFTNRILVGMTLFSMLFGAGNLIFPPFLGARAGTHIWLAFLGFLISAVLLPVLGVAAVALAGDLEKLAGRVHPWFASVFTILIYLSIGPFLAIPRTASTSFEMSILPFLSQEWGGHGQLLYTALFFCVSAVLSLRPDKLSDRIGKFMTPCLLFLIALIFAGDLFWPVGSAAVPAGDYQAVPLVQGVLDGYQTMDLLATMNFGIVIALNIRSHGVKEESGVVRETIFSGALAGILLVVVYGALAYVGMTVGGKLPDAENGARILTWVADALYGRTGQLLLAAIFLIACLNVCVGLISCCSTYFSGLCPKIPYQLWIVIFAGFSFCVSNAGLTRILTVSVPVLQAIYPLAIALIALSFGQKWIGKRRYVYPLCILFTAVFSITAAWEQAVGAVPVLGTALRFLPGSSVQLGWILPSVLGAAAGFVISGSGKEEKTQGNDHSEV